MTTPATPTTPTTPAAWRQRVLALAVPIILSNITVPLVGIVDTAVMGRMPSPVYLSATAIGAILFDTIFWVFGFLRMGTSGLVAQSLGANDAETLRRTTVRALLVGLCLGIVIVLLSKPLLAMGLWAMHGSAELHALTGDYFTIRVLAAPATLMSYAILGSLIGQQRMRSVFTLQLLLNCLNIFLNIVFFTYTDWHIKGVALATLIAEYVTLIVGLYLLRSNFVKHADNHTAPHANTQGTQQPPKLAVNSGARQALIPHWLFERRALTDFFRISGDLFVRTLCLTVAFYWLTAIGARQGEIVLAANAVLIQLLHFMAHALDGFANAAEALTGHAYGKRDRQALVNAIKAATFWASLMAIVFTLGYYLLGGTLIDLITTQPVVQQNARDWLAWIIVAPLIGVWSFLLDGIFVGTTHTREMRNGMLLSLLAFVIATLVLLPAFGNHGLWMSYHILMIFRAVTLGYWYPGILQAITHRAN